MQVLSSSQKKDITPSQLLPESMFDFIYAKDGEAVIKSGDTAVSYTHLTLPTKA